MRTLTPTELAVLGAVHRGDEEAGGLDVEDLEEDERDAIAALVEAGLVEAQYDDDGASWARITFRGVEALRDAAMR